MQKDTLSRVFVANKKLILPFCKEGCAVRYIVRFSRGTNSRYRENCITRRRNIILILHPPPPTHTHILYKYAERIINRVFFSLYAHYERRID